MCNLYAPPESTDAIRLHYAAADMAGNEPWPDLAYPDRMAPVICRVDGEAAVVKARWGLPSPSFALKGKKTDRGVTNVRNLTSPHWRRWLGAEHRCLVPFTKFAEPVTGGNQWFDIDEEVGCFAGVMVRSWRSVRKVKDGETVDDLFGFLTCEPNELVAPIHPKAMPVILTKPAELSAWLDGSDAVQFQRPYPARQMGLLD